MPIFIIKRERCRLHNGRHNPSRMNLFKQSWVNARLHDEACPPALRLWWVRAGSPYCGGSLCVCERQCLMFSSPGLNDGVSVSAQGSLSKRPGQKSSPPLIITLPTFPLSYRMCARDRDSQKKCFVGVWEECRSVSCSTGHHLLWEGLHCLCAGSTAGQSSLTSKLNMFTIMSRV